MPKEKTTSVNAAGSEVLAYCSSCRMDLAHMVVAMKGDKIAKAECKTCKKTHAYKAPKGITEPQKASSKGGGDDRKTIEMEWQRLMVSKKDSPTKSYDLKKSFVLGDKIAHSMFGE